MPVQVSFSIEGEQQVSRSLNIAANGVKNFREPLNRIGGELQKSFQANFDQRGALFQPGGWAKRKDDNPWPLLEKTGAMRGAFDSNITGDSVMLWNSADYFPYHQSNQPRTKLPRRIMLKIDQERKDFIVKAFQSYIVKLTRGQK